MTCKQCGHELQEGQRFCPHCGAAQQPDPQPDPQPGPQAPAGGGGLSPGAGMLILRIFAAICAIFYGVRAVARLIQVFTGLYSSLDLMGYRFFGGLFSLLGRPLMSLLLAVLYAWMCVILAALVLRRNREGSEPMFLGLCAGGALAIVVLILRAILLLLTFLAAGYGAIYYNWGSQLLLPVIGNAVAVGGVFLLLYLMGEAPLMGKSAGEIQALSSEVIGALKAAFASVKKDASAQPNRPGPNGQYQQNQYQQGPGAPNAGNPYPPGPAPLNLRPLKTDRGLLAYIVLDIITCGIYGYYFLYAMARDVNIACEGDGKKTGGLIAFILLSYITCGFYALYWYYSLGNRLAANAPRYGMNFQENGTTVLLWYLVGLLLCGIGPYVAMHYLIKNTNSICSAYNQAHGLYGN